MKVSVRSWNRLLFKFSRLYKITSNLTRFKRGWGETFTQVRRFPTLPCFSSGIVFCSIGPTFYSGNRFISCRPSLRNHSERQQSTVSDVISSPVAAAAHRTPSAFFTQQLLSLWKNLPLSEKQPVFSVLKGVSTHNSYLC